MSILVDDREGSKNLIPLLGNLAISTRLDFGDAAFGGNGPDGDFMIGVEVKTVRDLISSEMTGRLAGHQLPGLLSSYGRVYLLVVGYYRADAHGYIEVQNGKTPWRWHRVSLGARGMPYSYLEGFLQSLSEAGVTVKLVGDYRQAACWLAATQRWWGKPYDKHKSLHKFNRSGSASIAPSGASPNQEFVARVAKEFPGVGWDRAWAASNVFPSVRDMVCADTHAWEGVAGIGKVIAKAVVRALKG